MKLHEYRPSRTRCGQFDHNVKTTTDPCAVTCRACIRLAKQETGLVLGKERKS